MYGWLILTWRDAGISSIKRAAAIVQYHHVCVSTLFLNVISNLSKTHETRHSLNSSSSQVFWVYLKPIRRNSFLKYVPKLKIAKNIKLLSLGFSHLRSSKLIQLKNSSPLLVMISSMSVPICNCFHARRANISEITTF